MKVLLHIKIKNLILFFLFHLNRYSKLLNRTRRTKKKTLGSRLYKKIVNCTLCHTVEYDVIICSSNEINLDYNLKFIKPNLDSSGLVGEFLLVHFTKLF